MHARRWLVVIVMLSSAAPAARADQDVELQATKLTVRLPDDWAVSVTDDHGDQFAYANGRYIGTLHLVGASCADVLERTRTQHAKVVESTHAITAGWSGYFHAEAGLLSTDDRLIGVFCRDVGLTGTVLSAVVEAPEEQLVSLVAVADAAVERKLAGIGATPTEPTTERPIDRPPPARPTLLSRLRPLRYEVGVTMLDVGTDDFLTSERGVGAALEVSRPIYGVGPALGYRVRLQPTSVGLAGFAEVGAGFSLKYLSLLGIAGVGGAGRSAPFGVHYGGQVDLLIPLGFFAGMEASGSHAWCNGGTTTRIDGRFFIRPSLMSRRGFTFGIGWEQRVDSRIITINGGVMRVPGI